MMNADFPKCAKSPVLKAFLTAGIFTAIFFSIFFFFSLRAHHGFQTQLNDLGNADQAIWKASQGDWMMTVSNVRDGIPRSRFANHTNFIFWLFAAVYRIFPHEEFLLFLSCFSCAIAGFGLFMIARYRIGSSRLSIFCALIFWLSPMVQDAALFDFHVVTVAAALWVWMHWAFLTQRNVLAWILFGLALSANENMVPILFLYAFYLAGAGRPRHGGMMALIVVCFALGVWGFWIPKVPHSFDMVAAKSRYQWLGGTLSQAPSYLFQHADLVIQHLLRPDKLRIFVYLLISGAGIALPAWPLLMLMLPDMIVHMMSDMPWTTRITGTYYWVIAAAIMAAALIETQAADLKSNLVLRGWRIKAVLIVTCLISLFFSPLPYGLGSGWDQYQVSQDVRYFARFAAQIPDDAKLCVQNNLGAHLARRDSVASFPLNCDLRKSDYVFVFLRRLGGPNSGLFVRSSGLVLNDEPGAYMSKVHRIAGSPEWGIVDWGHGFYLFSRSRAGHPLPSDALKELTEDGARLKDAYYVADRGKWPTADRLNGEYSWKIGAKGRP